jgi:hypothetical protein
MTNAEGRFSMPYLPIGDYSITVTASGFRTVTRNGIPLAAGQVLDLEFKLVVGAAEQSITVSAEAESLSYETVDQHATSNSQKTHELPLAKLDWTGLMLTTNGVTSAGTSGATMNGLPPASLLLTVDGTNASSDPELPSVGFYQGFNQINTINSDAIAEVSVTKGILPASVSGSMAGNINIITKSGTNQFHGSALEFNSVNDYNARNQFLSTNPHSIFNQFGGSVGGPIRHDKLFFFLNYEGVRSSSFSAINGTVPTPLFISQAIAANPAYAKVMTVFPAPNQPYSATAQTSTWVGAGSVTQNDNNAVARIDYYLNSTNWLSLRYTDGHPAKVTPNLVAVNARSSTGVSDSYNAQFTHVSGGWTGITRIAYIRPDLIRQDGAIAAGVDEVKVSGLDTEGGTAAKDFQIRGGTYQIEENVSLIRGRHSLEFGGIVLRLTDGRINDQTNVFTYSNAADFLNNIPNQVQINYPTSLFQINMYQAGGFVQDNFHASPGLTINMGIRYDHWTVPKERNGHFYSRSNGPLGIGTGPWMPPDSVYNADWKGVSPRIGLAWSPGPDRKTVVRAGGGIFYNPHTIFAGPIELVLDNPNLPGRITYSRAQALALGLTYPVNRMQLAQQIISTATPSANTVIGTNFPNPYSVQWYLGVQRQLPLGLTLDTGYVGNRGVHLTMTRNVNLPDRQTGVTQDPQFGSFRYYDGSDASWYDSWQTSLSKSFSHGLLLGVNYSWAHNLAYGDADLNLDTIPQDGNNLRTEKGPTPYDVRHSFRANFVYTPQIAQWTHWNNRLGKLVLDGWQVSGILVAATGLPSNVVNGSSANATDRPDAVSGVGPVLGGYTGTLQYLNKAAFQSVPIVTVSGEQGRDGTLGRYALPTPGMWNLDLSIAKTLAVTEKVKLQLRGDAFNSLNHTNLGGLVTDISKSNFGRLTSATSRSMQIGAKVIF